MSPGHYHARLAVVFHRQARWVRVDALERGSTSLGTHVRSTCAADSSGRGRWAPDERKACFPPAPAFALEVSGLWCPAGIAEWDLGSFAARTLTSRITLGDMLDGQDEVIPQ